MSMMAPFICPYVTLRLGTGISSSEHPVANPMAASMATRIRLITDSKAALLVIRGLNVQLMLVKME